MNALGCNHPSEPLTLPRFERGADFGGGFDVPQLSLTPTMLSLVAQALYPPYGAIGYRHTLSLFVFQV